MPQPNFSTTDRGRANAHTIPAWVDRRAYPFHSRWIRVRDGTLHVVDEGTGDPIVFVHGTPTWSFEFRHLIRALSPVFRCIAPDHLGFGLSERPFRVDYSPIGHARRFEDLMNALALERFTLVVHDFGGPIALPFALAHRDRLTALVILNSWMWSLKGDEGFRWRARIGASALGRWAYRRLNLSQRVLLPFGFASRRKLTPQIHAQYLACFPDPASREEVLWPLAKSLLGASSFYDALWHARGRLDGVRCAVVWGERDRAFPRWFLQRWHEGLPHAQIVRSLTAGHWPQEEDPQTVVDTLRRLVAH